MTYAAEILADSLSPAGHRLTTFQITFPRIILAEFNTHRMLSRNSASSRAIPVWKRIKAILENPFVPEAFGANQSGMQAGEVMDEAAQAKCRDAWLRARDHAVVEARELVDIGVHKQWANRLLEPFSWHTAIVTATEWDNYWALRVSGKAQPEIRTISEMMKTAYDREYGAFMFAEMDDAPYDGPLKRLAPGEWHLPLVGEKYGDPPLNGHVDVYEKGVPLSVATAWYVEISVARCARVSYLTHDGVRNPHADQGLYADLVRDGHMSPLEHAARPMTAVELDLANEGFCGNFRGWVQHRKELPGEAVFTGGE